MIVFAVIMAFFLLMEYFKNRKGYHLMWGSALILTFIAFHQVANTGNYSWLLESWGSGFMVMIPGLIAGGILLSTFGSRPKVAQLYLLAMAIVASTVTIMGLDTIQGILHLEFMDFQDWNLIRLAITGVAAIISVGVILVVPIYTTLISKETTAKAYLMVIAGALLFIWIISYAISMTLVKEFVDTYNAGPAAAFNGPIENIGLFFVFGLFPYIFIFSMTFAVLGVMYEPKWKYPIPGVDVEDETRLEKISVQRNMPLISSVLCIAGGVVLLIGSVLAMWINLSQNVINAMALGILMIGGLLGAMVGAAVLMGWDEERNANTVIRIGLGGITLIFAIILITMPVWSSFFGTGDLMSLSSIPVWLWPESAIDPLIPSTFTLAEYQMKEALMSVGVVFVFVGPILILASGILSEFVFKE
jgi:MFS family permease